MNKSILYIVSARSFSSSNPGRKIYEVIEVWKRLGIKVHETFGKDIITQSGNDSYGNQTYHNSNLRKRKYLKFFINSYSELKDIIHNWKLYNILKKQYLNVDMDIVWERSSRLHCAGLKLARKKNIPFVLEWKDHLINYKFSLFKPLAQLIEKKKLRKANYIIVESSVLKNYLIKLNVNPNKIKIALNAVNPDEFKRNTVLGQLIKNDFQISNDKTVVGYLGSYAFYHNSLLLIEAAKQILEERKDIQFLLIGNGQDYLKCKKQAEAYNILNNGLTMAQGVPKEKVPHLLSAMDITVLPGSTDIICPIKIMEYMAAETVVIAPDYECNREIITDNINGYLFDSYSHNALVNKIILAVDNQQKSKQLQINAREYVAKKLIWENTWGKTLTDILEYEKTSQV